jgi:hypothetical protein
VQYTLDPFFATSSSYVSPFSGLGSFSGLHATAIGYDTQSRPVCSVYEPVSGGAVPAASTTPAGCAIDGRRLDRWLQGTGRRLTWAAAAARTVAMALARLVVDVAAAGVQSRSRPALVLLGRLVLTWIAELVRGGSPERAA